MGTWGESRFAADRWDDLPGLQVMQLAEAYRRRDVDVVASLSRFGLPWSTLRADTPLDYRRVLAWTEQVLDRWPMPGIGFDRVFHTRLPRYGVPGYMVLSAESLGRAIDQWQRYAPLFRPVVGTGLRGDGGHAELFVIDLDPPPFGEAMRRFCHERWLAGWQSALRALLGASGASGEVRCACAPPDVTAGPSRRLFRVPVCFDSADTAMGFPAARLHAPTRFGNLETHRLCAARCDALLAEVMARGGVAAQVRRLLLRDPVGFASQQAVARLLGLSERSMRRKLLESGSAFSELLHGVRMELALDHLRHTGRSIGEVARRLGYAEASAFARAFRRTHGQSPRSARRAAQAPPSGPERLV